jgi:hypothetical protein
MNSLTVFFATAFLSSLAIRLFADGLNLRLYVQKGRPHIFFMKRVRKTKGLHIHHFVWGMIVFGAAYWLLYFSVEWWAMLFSGLGLALIASEAKELVLQKWGP